MVNESCLETRSAVGPRATAPFSFGTNRPVLGARSLAPCRAKLVNLGALFRLNAWAIDLAGLVEQKSLADRDAQDVVQHVPRDFGRRPLLRRTGVDR